PGCSGQPCIGTSTAASVRPWASMRSASAGSSRSSDNDLDGSAIDAPGRARRIRGVLRAEEDDRARYLVHLGQSADRPLRAGGGEGGLAALLPGLLARLIEQATLLHPELGLDRTGADRVDQDAFGRVAVGEQAGERELGGL